MATSNLAEMKKKYRRAVYDAISVIICMIFSPLLLMGCMGNIAGWVLDKWLIPIATWLKTKLRVYDTDPD